ncbi:transporter substrate-binding domain-containing protein [Paraburkholderia sediminicola]|uniref:transporter substrate-binding domain-containing protein n=1 Tax=Paraburkholderia sediminicola TaxID=458836 RepID=UPI0038BB7C68
MKVKIAYIEEPPFGWADVDHTVTGADIELAETVLRAIGVTRVEHHLTTFAELLPGVENGRWDMNVPLFVTPQRMTRVDFSLPVWAISDGFLVRAGNPMALNSYESLAQRDDARLGIIAGQVQHHAAQKAGVSDDQIVLFDQQAEAIDALLTGKIDAYASTALGNRILADRIGHELAAAVSHPTVNVEGDSSPTGAFSFKQGSHELKDAVNRQLRMYLGSADHRRRMSRFGLTENEIDPVVIG